METKSLSFWEWEKGAFFLAEQELKLKGYQKVADKLPGEHQYAVQERPQQHDKRGMSSRYTLRWNGEYMLQRYQH